MTNREYMITLLSNPNFIDDGGASYEAMVFYNIDCPYFVGDKRALCKGKHSSANRDICFQCKNQWLDSEVDE